MASIDLDTKVAFGEVVDVQQVRSRGVTRIVIEVPAESHVMVTNLIFGKNAIVIPFYSSEEIAAKGIQAVYGVAPLSRFSAPANPLQVVQNGRPTQATRQGPPTPPPPTTRQVTETVLSSTQTSEPKSVAKPVNTMLGEARQPGQVREPKNYAANAAMLCEDPTFWQFLAVQCDRPVASVEDAIIALRSQLGVTSRGELNRDPGAAQRFLTLRGEYNRSLQP